MHIGSCHALAAVAASAVADAISRQRAFRGVTGQPAEEGSAVSASQIILSKPQVRTSSSACSCTSVSSGVTTNTAKSAGINVASRHRATAKSESQNRVQWQDRVVNHGPIRLFSGNANPELANAIAQEMGVPLSDATVGRFKCGEVNVVINESVRDCDVFLIQPTCNGGAGPQEHFMELLIMIDAIHRGAANRITAVMPLFGYARQNAKERSRSPITAKLVTDLLQVAGADRVLTLELHASQIQGFASYPIDNMYAMPLLADEIQKLMDDKGLTSQDIVVVSPDVGGAKRASAFAARLCAPLAIFSRQRRRPTSDSEIDLVGDVAGKTCIVVDTIADTAETLIVAAHRLKEKGASAVIGAIVHAVLSPPACELINESPLEVVLVTDSIPLNDKLSACPKLKVISVASVLASAIANIHTSESLSILFDEVTSPRVKLSRCDDDSE